MLESSSMVAMSCRALMSMIQVIGTINSTRCIVEINDSLSVVSLAHIQQLSSEADKKKLTAGKHESLLCAVVGGCVEHHNGDQVLLEDTHLAQKVEHHVVAGLVIVFDKLFDVLQTLY